MTEATRMNVKSGINSKNAQYNSVRSKKASVTDIAATSLHRVGDVVAERNRRALREKAKEPVVVKKRVKAGPFPISFVFYTLVMMVILMFIVYNNSVVNELSYEAGELESRISAAEQENERLSLELDRKYDLTYIENVAKNELGLVKSTEVKKYFISLSDGDKVVVSGKGDGSRTGFGTSFDSLRKSVAKIYE